MNKINVFDIRTSPDLWCIYENYIEQIKSFKSFEARIDLSNQLTCEFYNNTSDKIFFIITSIEAINSEAVTKNLVFSKNINGTIRTIYSINMTTGTSIANSLNFQKNTVISNVKWSSLAVNATTAIAARGFRVELI